MLINYLPKRVVAGPGRIFALLHMYPANTAVAERRFLDMIHARN
jgi:hypothetical protein